jgi:hypothetical protein
MSIATSSTPIASAPTAPIRTLETEELGMELLDCGPAYKLNDVGVRCVLNCGCYCIAVESDGQVE